jgi:outer membrane protein
MYYEHVTLSFARVKMEYTVQSEIGSSKGSYQAVQASTDTVKDSVALPLDIAQRSFSAAQRRYQAGVGNILELLSAQTALANPQQRRIQALADWRATPLRLAGSLGRLGTADMQ